MCKLIEEELKKHLEKDDFCITVYTGDTVFLCFPLSNSVDIYRLEGNHLTRYEKEISADLEDYEEVETHCIQIEEQRLADNKK